ncbi:putative endonuclease LCL3 [Trematosphaeria pertusa]|uniref:Probable endonuclease LCL3 n=1 Tax=Trematosphaeria pertusa TaxID=390896 RepID=A0A6A6ISA3_9PLEO|nr:putative endonuclease LCL3 [Trematosphaeria pertusa]KAF2253159.1 putative endonuclease LCL3 [Trematosphaeria pertusa]
MRWPLSGDDDDKKKSSFAASVERLKSTDWSSTFTDPRTLGPSLVLTVSVVAILRLYKSYLRRIPSVSHIKPNYFRRRSLFGQVTSVGDADNFRLFHTPGGRIAGWGWLPWKKVPTTREGLANKTIHIRIAGVDAPELAHWGREAQPYSQEALDWLTKYILNRRVRAYIYRRDQYDRVVAQVYVRNGLFRRDVGLEMLRNGLASVYEAKTGSEFGNFEQRYREAEERAKEKKIGMWTNPGILRRLLGESAKKPESPREYKTRHAAAEKQKKTT